MENIKNIIAIPPYYTGTSFEDIVESLKIASSQINVPITFMGSIRPLANTVAEHQLDTKEYLVGQFSLLHSLQQRMDGSQRILFLDFCNPGMDLLLYHAEQNNLSTHFGALFHGASFIDADIMKNQGSITPYEFAWLASYKKVYVSSFRAIDKYFPDYSGVAIMKRWGLDHFVRQLPKLKTPIKKEWDVIYPHRLCTDKGVERFVKIVRKLPDVSFCVAIPKEKSLVDDYSWYELLKTLPNVSWVFGESGVEHLETLAKGKIILSCSYQELFGYSVIKSIIMGCVPVVPDEVVYKEIIDESFRYVSVDDACGKIRELLHVDRDRESLVVREMRSSFLEFSFVGLLEDFFCS